MRGGMLGGAIAVAMLGLLPAALADGMPEPETLPVARQTKSLSQKPAGLQAAKRALAPLKYSAFPYRGKVPETGKPFLDAKRGKLRGHTSQRGGVYLEKHAYSDRRTLLYIPKGFDVKRPALIIVFFHGNEARLERDVQNRQQVLEQIERSGLNAMLVAPQLAVYAKDSSAGNFWKPGFFATYLKEATRRLAALHGGSQARRAFAQAPVVLVAYSGGYVPAAYAADVGGAEARIAGMILLDAPYGDEERIANWFARRTTNAFLVSAHGPFARESNRLLRKELATRGVLSVDALPEQLAAGGASFLDLGDEVDHHEFVMRAWVEFPLTDLLARIEGYRREP
jgi:hypothetical protein